MKKATRKIMALFLSVVMVLAMGISVFAADADKVTLTINGKAGAEYSVYQVMSAAKVENSDNLYQYTVTGAFTQAFPMTTNGKTYDLNGNNEICVSVTADGKTTLTPISTDSLDYNKTTYNRSSDTAAVAAYLESYAKENGIAATETVVLADGATSGTATVNKGYYVIKQTKVPTSTDGKNSYVASKAILVNLTENKTVTAKDDTEKLDKTITGLNTDTSGNADENTAKIGNKINYKVTTYIPTYGADVKKDSLVFSLYDTFSDGITYNNDIKVYIGDTEGATTTELGDNKYTEDNKNGATFTVNLNADTIWDNQGKYVTLVYSGTLNEKAKVNSSEGNPNQIELDYTNSPDETTDHLKDEVKTYTFGLGVKKVDKATQEELDGAKFTLTKAGESEPIKLIKVDDDTYRVAKNNEKDTVTEIEVNSKSGHNPVIKGLDEGKYVLHEAQAPDSYSVVGDITVTITAKTGTDGKLTGAAEISVSEGKTQQGDAAADDGIKVTTTDGTININVYVEDTKGISLPETGSKTAMYCLLGGALLVAMGGVFFGLTSRKKIR